MATQGMDPSDIIMKISDVIKARQKGVALEDAVEEIFKPEELPPAGAPQVEQMSPAPVAPVGGISSPEQGGGLQSLLSSLTSGGQASASARTVVRR